MDCGSSFDYNIAIKRRLMKDNMTFCPTLLEKFEYLRTNGRIKAGASEETPAHYYNTYAREGYLLSDCLSLLPG